MAFSKSFLVITNVVFFFYLDMFFISVVIFLCYVDGRLVCDTYVVKLSMVFN